MNSQQLATIWVPIGVPNFEKSRSPFVYKYLNGRDSGVRLSILGFVCSRFHLIFRATDKVSFRVKIPFEALTKTIEFSGEVIKIFSS